MQSVEFGLYSCSTGCFYQLKQTEQQLILAGLDVGTARVGGSHGGRLWRSLSVCFSVALLGFRCERAVGVLLAELPDEAAE